MDMQTSLAIKSYANALEPQSKPGIADGQDGAISDFANILRESETQALTAMNGGGDAHQLVQSLAQTELAVEAAVTIRNKVVEAYQEILRMPV